jgi:hypothetical protein
MYGPTTRTASHQSRTDHGVVQVLSVNQGLPTEQVGLLHAGSSRIAARADSSGPSRACSLPIWEHIRVVR